MERNRSWSTTHVTSKPPLRRPSSSIASSYSIACRALTRVLQRATYIYLYNKLEKPSRNRPAADPHNRRLRSFTVQRARARGQRAREIRARPRAPIEPSTSSMSVDSKSLPAPRVARVDEGGGNGVVEREEEGGGGSGNSRKQKPSARYDRCFSGLELSSIGSGPLKDVDAGKLKDQIRRWAKAVVAFARQISFGSPRSAIATTSSGGGDDTPRPATLAASSSTSSRLGGAKYV